MSKLLLPLLLLLGTLPRAFGQTDLKQQIGDTLNAIANRDIWVGDVRVRNLYFNHRAKTATIAVSSNLSYLPFRPETVDELYAAIRAQLPPAYKHYKLTCRVDRDNIDQLVPNYYRSGKPDKTRQFRHKASAPPLVTNTSTPNRPTRGLQGKHIALWPSHGWHYDQRLARWEWQRARLLQTVEDLYTPSYVLPLLTPMLEHAGANVLLPRERDTQRHEVIVDNDGGLADGRYEEHPAALVWGNGDEAGFAHVKDHYLYDENPFRLGTYRQCPTTRDEAQATTAAWIPRLPEAGRYAVYVSYHSLPTSTEAARYTVHHRGGTTHFTVNQRMGGGTWIYLGTFDFEGGLSPQNGRVELSNYDPEKNRVVTADAVKFGGGMGNMARSPLATDTLTLWSDTAFVVTDTQGVLPDSVEAFPPACFALLDSLYPTGAARFTADSIVRRGGLFARKGELQIMGRTARDTLVHYPSPFYVPEVSGYPRYAEGARYWLQWAGVPDSVYSRTGGHDDYSDDFQSRGFWVNYLSGGSDVSPKDEGLHIPLDAAIGFHTDAGTTPGDSIIGTLAICTTFNTEREYVYKNGVSRRASRDLADLVQTQVVHDLRLTHAPEWTRRGLWDKSYSESRVPEVPSMLLELLAHQNFADMRYGLDPRFRFTVCRAIYKGLLKYFESVDGMERTVQPLPVEAFHIRFTDHMEIELAWQPVPDPLEPSARPTHYIIYTKMDSTGWDNGYLLHDTRCRFTLTPDHVYSFRVTAVNEGGESFPSETLSACRTSADKGTVLVVNAFDRVSAPASFAVDSTYAGFVNARDAGVPYGTDLSFTGEQYEFRRDVPWADDDAPGFGASHGNHEASPVAGNTFDYPALHGQAIRQAGYSFVSASKKAVLDGAVALTDYPTVDLILGKQRETFIGNRHAAPEFQTFPLALQKKIAAYYQGGGHLLVSGAHVASDLYQSADTTGRDRRFVTEVLRCRLRNAQGSRSGAVRVVQSPAKDFQPARFHLYDSPNPHSYYVECTDAIEPIDARGYTVCRYADNNLSAGVATDAGTYKICALGFPFETIKEENERNKLMEAVLRFFRGKE